MQIEMLAIRMKCKFSAAILDLRSKYKHKYIWIKLRQIFTDSQQKLLCHLKTFSN